MTGHRRAARRRAALVALPLVLGVSGSSMFVHPESAWAHATLEHTVPAANAHLAVEPHQVVLSFDQPVNLRLGQATAIGPGGVKVATDVSLSDGGKTITISLRPGAGTGAYVVSYRVVSLDTHPVAGGFAFQVGQGVGAVATAAPSAGAGPGAAAAGSATATSAPEDTTVRAVYAACRYAGFLGLLLLIGGAVFLTALWPARVPDRRARRLVWLGYALTVAGSMGELVLQAPYAAGTALTAITGADFDDVVATRFGTVHLVRLGLLAVAAPVLVGLSRQRPAAGGAAADDRSSRWATLAAAALGIGLLLTWAYSGHAGTTVPLVSVPSDVVHLAAMTVWIGGLVVLAAALLPVAAGVELAAMLPRWSRLAMACVAALIVSGSVQALVEVGGWRGLADTTYGQLLLVKIGLLVVVLTVADTSRRWVGRHHAGAAGPEIRRLRRGIGTETAFCVAAVAVAAVLIQAEPGRDALAPPPPSATTAAAAPITRHGPYRATVRKGDVVIDLKVDPAVVGVEYIYMGARRPDGRRLPVRQWTLTVSNERLGLDQVNVPVLIDSGVGHDFIYGSFTMSVGGTWTVQVTARTSDVDETVVTRTVRVRS